MFHYMIQGCVRCENIMYICTDAWNSSLEMSSYQFLIQKDIWKLRWCSEYMLLIGGAVVLVRLILFCSAWFYIVLYSPIATYLNVALNDYVSNEEVTLNWEKYITKLQVACCCLLQFGICRYNIESATPYIYIHCCPFLTILLFS